MATSTGIIGHIQEFQPENELLSSYLERVQLFFIANDVVEEKKVAVFLSVIGSKTYSLLRNLLAPNLQQNQAYAALMETLKKHFEPKPVVIAERFHFHSRNQAIGETISTYLAELVDSLPIVHLPTTWSKPFETGWCVEYAAKVSRRGY